ncbi:MAG: heme-binding protein, partial [Planctomycetota bacterium]
GLRLPSKSACRVVLVVVDREGIVLGVRRMEDAAVGALDSAIAKARTARLYSDPLVVDEDGALQGLHPLTGLVPAGTAVTTRTLWFLSQPFFPPGIDASAPDHDMVAPFDAGSGPLYELAIENRKPFRFEQMGFAPAAPIDPGVQDDSQNGLCFVAGGIPVYRAGALIGAIGVCGDGPAQSERVASEAIAGASLALGFDLSAPHAIRANQFAYQGATLPYAKSPQNPDG